MWWKINKTDKFLCSDTLPWNKRFQSPFSLHKIPFFTAVWEGGAWVCHPLAAWPLPYILLLISVCCIYRNTYFMEVFICKYVYQSISFLRTLQQLRLDAQLTLVFIEKFWDSVNSMLRACTRLLPKFFGVAVPKIECLFSLVYSKN